jgi:uncharacterized RDD family membrane protein YckC
LSNCANCGTPETAGQQFCSVCGQPTPGSVASLGPMPRLPVNDAFLAGTQLAGYGWRVLSLIADVVLIGLIISLPLKSANLNSYVTSYIDVAVVFAYGTICLARFKGQTIGMRLVRTRCVDAVTHAQMSVAQIVRRSGLHSLFILIAASYHYTLYLNPTAKEKILNNHNSEIAFLFAVPLIIDLLWPIWDKRNQTLHDKFANTLLVRASKY